jgi:hypothetical protein
MLVWSIPSGIYGHAYVYLILFNTTSLLSKGLLKIITSKGLSKEEEKILISEEKQILTSLQKINPYRQ